MMKLILASRSPRRQELLKKAGFDFEIQPALLDESPRPNETPQIFVKRVAKEKAFEVARLQKNSAIILAADTIVVLEDEILGKPKDENEARQMLKKLSGKTHQVLTSWILIKTPQKILKQETETTFITFKQLSQNKIANYLDTKEYRDKAGAYAIQGEAKDFVKIIEGSLTNVIGLPIEKLIPHLKKSVGVFGEIFPQE